MIVLYPVAPACGSECLMDMVRCLDPLASLASDMHADPAHALGVVCGALIHLTRSREHSSWRAAIFFVISLVGGYYLSCRALLDWPHVEPWFAGFVCSAMLVSVAMLSFDWTERRIVPTLDRLYRWLVRRICG
ncbi:hypothetical protein [Caballeronia sp. LZ034LL]|uniref:hypothetical protein n=1 Tax=Caballeronia sp. LZ034LL TaxID=3038567 RepID=UPI0028543A6B|nr:hypothetical protein [Caballeronia sp. LZ034LL]MDR5833173.1 hypothetical protein [Caballeronia sp. LZ034LL]